MTDLCLAERHKNAAGLDNLLDFWLASVSLILKKRGREDLHYNVRLCLGKMAFRSEKDVESVPLVCKRRLFIPDESSDWVLCGRYRCGDEGFCIVVLLCQSAVHGICISAVGETWPSLPLHPIGRTVDILPAVPSLIHVGRP